MARFAWLIVALACFTFAGCGGGGDAVTPENEVNPAEGTNVQGDLEKAGITEEEYARRLKGGPPKAKTE